ncbi:MAG: DUF4162 domain-containing protein, partial [Candidatus Diapherotrites archaeon]|nr:DUF4162 domain-containing protein [Candidatus Diapherotrites archaeon]
IQVRKIIRKLQKEKGTTIILTTHYMNEAEELSDRIAIMSEGQIVGIGTAEELKQKLRKSERISIQHSAVNVDVSALTGESILSVHQEPHLLEVVSSNSAEALPGVLDVLMPQARVRHVNVEQATLEDVFVKLTGGKLDD